MLWSTSGVDFPHQNKVKKKVSINIRQQMLSFQGTAQQIVDPRTIRGAHAYIDPCGRQLGICCEL
jgi:hypothetical protein